MKFIFLLLLLVFSLNAYASDFSGSGALTVYAYVVCILIFENLLIIFLFYIKLLSRGRVKFVFRVVTIILIVFGVGSFLYFVSARGGREAGLLLLPLLGASIIPLFLFKK